MIRVLIADDHPLVRAGVRELLSAQPDIGEIGEVGTGTEALCSLREGHWNLVLLDISMPERGGLDILGTISTSFPHVKVLMLSGHSEQMYALRAIRRGAQGYISKLSVSHELLEAIAHVMQGRLYVSAEVAGALVKYLIPPSTGANHDRLTDREFQVLCKLAAGNTMDEISTELCRSVKTISRRRTRILRKMNFSSNADIIVYAMRHELIQ
jgi:DNA-binding NarL/FixJ family response regulator